MCLCQTTLDCLTYHVLFLWTTSIIDKIKKRFRYLSRFILLNISFYKIVSVSLNQLFTSTVRQDYKFTSFNIFYKLIHDLKQLSYKPSSWLCHQIHLLFSFVFFVAALKTP